MNPLFGLICAFAVLLPSAAIGSPAGDRVTFTRQSDRIRIEIGGAHFSDYIHAGWPKPCLHPILDADGTSYTRDHPFKRNPAEVPDHDWHRGVWFAHGLVNGHDLWRELPDNTTGRIVLGAILETRDGPTGILRVRMMPPARFNTFAFVALGAVVATAATEPPARIPAFPGAEGAGRFASGGRGGEVYRVTTLDASGPGSLADAVSQPNRIVVFTVSGIIDLARGGKGGRIVVAQPNITIAGQTAPGEGICLRGGSIDIRAGNVILRHLRSRRGYIAEGNMGDSISVKPLPTGEETNAVGRTAEDFEKIRIKKIERGRPMSAYADIDDILIDHCSASWATDENLTMTHAGRSTLSWCIAAEGLDYENPNQTPPRHSEGGLWGSAAPDGRSTLHHVLYAHNRLRNPRTTGGDDVPPVLTLYNNVVYNWSEHASHTGSQRVHVQWLGNYYQPGADTPADARHLAFKFFGDPAARVYARGNVLAGSAEATRDNRLAIGYAPKLDKLTPAARAAMIADQPFTELPDFAPAETARERVLADAGATLPARDAVDDRLVRGVRENTGRVIEKETDLPPADRWPDYRSLPAPTDSDADGLPDFWEQQFGLDPRDAADSARLSAAGYANIEHYFNNTSPAGDTVPIVHVAALVSRADRAAGRAGQWRLTRSGDTRRPLEVSFTLGGDARPGADFASLAGTVTIPAGESSVLISLIPTPSAAAGRMAVLTLQPGARAWRVGCPSASLIVLR